METKIIVFLYYCGLKRESVGLLTCTNTDTTTKKSKSDVHSYKTVQECLF
jgi:hypothetical protein